MPERGAPSESGEPRAVPFFRPSIGEAEAQEVLDVLRSGWLTSGPRVRTFEEAFAGAVGAKHALAVNSCTAALHLAVEALELRPGQGVLVPTMTFAATAEVVRYQGAVPILVDCDPETSNMNLSDMVEKADRASKGALTPAVPDHTKVVGIMPVHVGGLMLEADVVRDLARGRGWWVVEDAAHSFPAAFRAGPAEPWRVCGADTADVTCFSFYANKTITTGEGGMAVTADPDLAARMKLMSLHGLSRDAWDRYSGGGSWDYKIIAPGYKYNLTDIAAAIGIHQLKRAEEMRIARERVAGEYLRGLADVPELEVAPTNPDRIHSWHLFPIRLVLERLRLDRNAFIDALREERIGCSVHWRPLHLHPYYADSLGWRPEHCLRASEMWLRLVSLPIFSGMQREEIERVIDVVRGLCQKYRR